MSASAFIDKMRADVRRRLLAAGVYPRSGLARFALWVAGLYLFSEALALVFAHPLSHVVKSSARWAGIFSGWAGFFEFVFICVALWLFFRWVRQKLMWRLRNRLIVTYVFIGVIPVVLILTMVGIAGYILGNQLTTMLVNRDLLAEVESLDTLNATVSLELMNELQAKRAAPLHLASLEPPSTQRFPNWSIAASFNGKPLAIAAPAAPADLADPKRDISGILTREHAFVIRSFRSTKVSGGSLQVVLVVPVSAEFLSRAVPDLGLVTLYSFEPVQGQSRNEVKVHISEDKNHQDEKDFTPTPAVRAGAEPAVEYSIDPPLTFGSVFRVTDWSNGKGSFALVRVSTRASVLNHRVFTDLGEVGSAILVLLAAVAIAFGVIELVALIIGVSLSRTITKSIAKLYRATQHINRGDLDHRIRVQTHDQLASLETSFNSMSESLQRLLAEQKEKQRMENELAIAQEVQAQLFPRDPKKLESLELYGICKPARTVSGDYYDFVSLGHERLGIAVGDISGKGISAALLMATIHSAVRVFELGAMPEQGELVAAGAAAVAAAENVRGQRWSVAAQRIQSPAEVLTLLNRHVYHSTPPEKYATLFLGIFDGHTRRFIYSNGGHLPPFVIHDSGEVRKLETGGLVVGLFPEVVLEEEEVKLSRGDIFLAFSDGVTEPENDFGEFGEDRLLELVRSNRHLPLERISEIAIGAVQDWIGEREQPDDITLVLARVR
ncbi:MAG: PP2C family protein-serine/threonine phosphatase [Acidobacteria bacterium]|nr:PP2C family protein-serine/threonine phosphatase [Acidobacteriota bacterium]MBV9435378.1 PP2C family protein-serine/threonine phosphatase [Acidobacteriota bacterium]